MIRPIRWLLYFVGFLVVVITVIFSVGQYYRPELLSKVNELLKKNVNGDISIGGLDFTFFKQFPAFSITLSDISLKGTRYAMYHKDLFSAKKIHVHIKLGHLLAKELDLKSISIEDANLFIFRASDGYTNLDAFRKGEPRKAKGKSALQLALGNIEFRNTRVQYMDSVKGKSYGAVFTNTKTRIEPTDSSQQITHHGTMTFLGLTMNPVKGSYLLNQQVMADLNLEFVPESKEMFVRPSSLQFQKSLVGLEGRFNFGPPSDFQLHIQSQAIHFSEGVAIVTKAIAGKLEKLSFEKPLKLSVSLDGVLTGGEPKIDIAFATSGNTMKAGSLAIDSLSMSGTFMNHSDSTQASSDPNTRVSLDQFSGLIKGLPTKGQIGILNLKDPYATLNLSSQVSLTDLNKECDTTRIQFLSGTYQSEIHFQGRLSEYLNDTTTNFSSTLTGSVHVKDGSWKMMSVDKTFEKGNVDISFTEKQMELQKVNFIVNGNPIEINGVVRGYVPFFFQPKDKGYVKLSVQSPRLDLATMLKKSTGKKKVKSGRKKRVSELLDVLYAKIEFDIDLKVNELRNGPFLAKDIQGRFTLMRDRFDVKKARMKVADGSAQLDLSMTNLNKDTSNFLVVAKVKDANVQKLFSSFNNFGLKSIKAENLSGSISVDANLSAKLDGHNKLILPSADGRVNLRIKDGSLKDLEPLMSMTNFLMKNRDFTNVKFAEINSSFKVSGSSIDIARMEIQSSVITLFVDGTYSMEQHTDLSIQIPLSNLKKRDKDFKPENVGPDAKVGPSVFLRAKSGKEGKVGIAYDPLKKLHKKKKS